MSTTTRHVQRSEICPARSKGFTILEIAIVLVVLGLIVGGIVMGQELVASAKARSLINQQQELRVAFYNFQDRYQFPPGDYNNAIAAIGATRNGDGDGRIKGSREGGTENILAWEHLSRAGLIENRFTYSEVPPYDHAIVRGPFGSFLDVAFDNWHGDPATTDRKIHNIKTGSGIPAAILGEVDIKIDDGKALSGTFQFSDFSIDGEPVMALGGAPACVSNDAVTFGKWNVATSPSSMNCGAATLL